MDVQTPDAFPETDSSADALQEVFRKKFLDLPALTRAFVGEILSGKAQEHDTFVARAEPHHHRVRYDDDAWGPCLPDETFDITFLVREALHRPMTGPHPHNWEETWRDDGKCIVKSCKVWRS